MSPLRIMVADDHAVVRCGLRALLEAQPDWEVCAEAADGRDVVKQAAILKPDVIIMDIAMPNLNGLEATRQLLKMDPGARVLILTLHDSEQVIHAVLSAGARGFLLKSDASRDVVSAVDALRQEKTYFTSKVSSMVLRGYLNGGPGAGADASVSPLTAREREIVQLLAEGKSSKEVACALGLTVKTAETHRSNIMRKMEFHSVSDLVLYAVRNNIVDVGENLAA